MLLADENDRIVGGSFWANCNCSGWKLANKWHWYAADFCWITECRFTHINVCFSIVYYCKFMSVICYLLSSLDVLLNCLSFYDLYLALINFQSLVIRTKSVEFMPFYLSLSTFLMSTCFFMYGLFNDDVFIYVSFPQNTVCISLSLSLSVLPPLVEYCWCH